MSTVDYISFLDCAFGKFKISSSDQGIRSITQVDEVQEEFESHHSFLCRQELLDFFDGRLKQFTVNLDLSGYTEFHQKVWKELQNIPYGRTISYLQLSKNIQNEKAIRAVGRANGLNPIPFVIPCHRVIGSDGSLTGYALGLEMKSKLLNLENPVRFPLQHSLF